MAKVKVLIVDDSAVVRQTLTEVLSSDPDIEVMGAATDPYNAAEKMREEVPDVITLDVEMPRMDGITFLQKLMKQHPIPVIICSTLAEGGCKTAMKALECGAVEVIQKPVIGTKKFLEESKVRICDVVKAAALAGPAKVRAHRHAEASALTVAPKLTADAILQKGNSSAMIKTTEKVVVVGASTGGTEALVKFLQGFPMDGPAIVVVQHMPEKFTAAFAERLNSICAMQVKEAADNDTVMSGRALIAPGNRHLLLKRSGARYYVEVNDGPLVSRHRPSVDVLFRSAARYGGGNVVGVIMTGMGDDGARGMVEIKENGGYTMAQDEATCVVFGMPNEAIKRGCVDKILPLQSLAGAVINAVGRP